MIKVDKEVVGVLGTNFYILEDEDTKNIAVIDPGGISKKLDAKIKNNDIDNIKYILITHGHFDHIMKAEKYRSLTNAKIVICKHENDFTSDETLNLSSTFKRNKVSPFTADITLNDGDTIKLGNSEIKLMHTPGHTKGGACYICEDKLFSGDTLMRECIGRTDFETGSFEDLKSSLQKIVSLPGDYEVYPGHGEKTTLEFERENNIYLRKIKHDNLY